MYKNDLTPEESFIIIGNCTITNHLFNSWHGDDHNRATN